MKKLMSLITSMAMALCIVSVMLSAAVPATYSADDAPVLTAGYMDYDFWNGITVELNGDAIVFKSDNKIDEALVSTQTEISLLRDDKSIIFKPLRDGRYVVSLLYYLPYESPKYETIWFPPVEDYTFEILIRSNVVNIEGIHKLSESPDENYEILIESILPNNISFNTYGYTGTLFGTYYLIVCLSNGFDPVFLYYLSDRSDPASIADESIIASNDPNAEAYYLVNDKYEKTYGYELIARDFPDIGKKSMPSKGFDLCPFVYSECPPNGTAKIILNEGKKTKVYELGYTDYQPLPSTLKITECPENDINADGSFNIADVLQLQKYLLGNTDASVFNWRAADMNSDGVLDVFDLIQLKRALIASVS